MRYSLFEPKTSFVHSLDPRTKLVWLLTMFSLAVLFVDPLFTMTIFASIIVVMVTSKLSISRLLPQLRAIALVACMSVLLWPIWIKPGNVLVSFGSLRITDLGLFMGVGVAFRLATLMSVGPVFLMTTSQRDFIAGLTHLKLPYKVVFLLSTSFRFLPAVIGEIATITEAQASRGLELDKGSILERFRKRLPILIPTIILSIKSSQNLAIAIESRAFGAYKDRTCLSELKLRRADCVFYVICLSVLAFGFWLRLQGYGTIE